MASESSRPLSLFPGSNPEGSTSLGDHIPLPPPTPASRKGTYARPTTQASRKPQLASHGLPKNTTRHGSQNSSTSSFSSPSRDRASPYRSDSAYKDESKVTGSKYPRMEQRAATSPRVAYHEFMVLDQAGSAIIGCDNTKEHNLVAIKRLKNGIGKSSMRGIQPFTSDHVVNIRESYFDNEDLVIIYERMDVSLRHVTSILQGPFKPSQIAAVCKQLVAGLSYIHETLSLCHGELSCGTILLNLDGLVKIANIGESFVRNIYTTAENRRGDVHSIGFVMMELMEPTTYILNPHSVELRSPEKWNDGSGIKGFLSATQHQSFEQLRSHNFLPKEPLAKCLKGHVLCALIAAGTHWDILSLP